MRACRSTNPAVANAMVSTIAKRTVTLMGAFQVLPRQSFDNSPRPRPQAHSSLICSGLDIRTASYGASVKCFLSFALFTEEERAMKFFVVALALAVTAWTQAMAFEPLHHRHSRMTRQAEA